MTTDSVPSPDGYSQLDNTCHKALNHLKLVSWTWQWVHWTKMASTVTRSQSNREALGCARTGDSHHGSAATAWCDHVNMDQNLWGMFPAPMNLCYEELWQSWRKKGFQPRTSKVYLIKWLVSVPYIQ